MNINDINLWHIFASHWNWLYICLFGGLFAGSRMR